MCIDYKGGMFQHGLKVPGIRPQKARPDGIGRRPLIVLRDDAFCLFDHDS